MIRFKLLALPGLVPTTENIFVKPNEVTIATEFREETSTSCKLRRPSNKRIESVSREPQIGVFGFRLERVTSFTQTGGYG